MVVGFTTTYAISAYHHWCCELKIISIRARCTTLCDKVCEWLATGRWFSVGTPVSSTNKTDRPDITEILLKVVLNTITLSLSPANIQYLWCETQEIQWWCQKGRLLQPYFVFLLKTLDLGNKFYTENDKDIQM